MRLLVFLSFLLPPSLSAQQLGYKEHLRLAERFEELGEYLKSGEQYARAHAAKPKKTEHAYKSAEFFYQVKDYARAAEQYALVRRDWRAYPFAGLRYARSLKQDGRFEEAVAAYKDYLGYYGGADADIVRGIVEKEVRGAAMAQQSLREFNGTLSVEPFGPTVNGSGNESAPMPLSAEAVYFLRDEGGYMRMYRTVRGAGGWGAAEPAAQFPTVPGKHIGAGSLNPTGDRFYFGLSDGRATPTQPAAPSKLYVIERAGEGWTAPQPLPSYINTPGSAVAHPFVYRDGDKEVLLFSSDKIDEESQGGMDLYRTERLLSSEGTDFSFPDHLGPEVNGRGDEVSPHYDARTQVLHFASNGNINMGGYDVFRTMGSGTAYNLPENLGAPVNSPADDYYYRPIPGTREAVLSSNRAVRDAKTRTSNEDLFLVRPGTPTLSVSLQVVDSATARGLAGATLAAFVREDGRERLVTNARTDDGFFELDLPMAARVEVRVQREGYTTVERTVDVPKQRREGFQVPQIRMQRMVVTLADAQEIEAGRTGAASGRLPTAQPASVPRASVPRATAGAPTDREPAPAPVRSTNPRLAVAAPPAPARRAPAPKAPEVSRVPATEYRVQIEAARDFDPRNPRYAKALAIGELSSDLVEGRGLYRVLVGRYDSLSEARVAMRAARRAGWGDAFVAKVEGGVYGGAVR